MTLKLIIPVVILFTLAIIFGCKSQKKTLEDLQDSEAVALIFGSSGGFAGITTKYMLYEDGSLFQWVNNKSYEAIKPLDKNLAGQFFSNFSALGLDRADLNDPGNMTYFIIVQSGDRKKKLAWGGMNKEMPDNLDIYYRNFMKTMKKHNLGVEM